jgi:hypothetical protein
MTQKLLFSTNLEILVEIRFKFKFGIWQRRKPVLTGKPVDYRFIGTGIDKQAGWL